MSTPATTIRWGVLGTGMIATAFVRDLALLPGASVVAVGSRSREGAEAFGERFAIPHRHASYADLVADPEVDAVYVATPHPGHHAAALLAIEAGKAVLVEKPFTINAAEARSLASAAAARGTFLMEAMWTRFLPHVVRIRELLADGALGRLRTLQADHGQRIPDVPRLREPELGGGALLDLGIYPVSFARMVLGAPTRVVAVSDPLETGVDAQTSILLDHEGGAHAVLTTVCDAQSPNRAAIVGTEGRIEIDPVWYTPTGFTLHRVGREPERIEIPHEGHGLRHEAAEVGRCLVEGRTESDVLPIAESVAIMETLDEVRRQIGLRYPSER